MPTAPRRSTSLTGAYAALGLAASAVAFAFAFSPAAVAQTAATKAVVDAAKTRGLIGEQGDGYLGAVVAPPPADVAAAMAQINAGRAAAYRDVAARTGATAEAAGRATAVKLFYKLPRGQYFKPLGGDWTKN